MAEFSYNNRQYSSTEKSPFFMNLRRYPNIYRQEKILTKKVLEIDKFVQEIREARKYWKE